MSCSDCQFYDRAHVESTEGRCRRYPPATIVRVSEEDGEVRSRADWLFPWVGGDDYCGEWKAR